MENLELGVPFQESNLEKQTRELIEQTDPGFVMEKLKPIVTMLLRTMDVQEVEELLKYGFSRANKPELQPISDSEIANLVQHCKFNKS